MSLLDASAPAPSGQRSITGARSNSFNFGPVRDVPRAPGAPCPLRLTESRLHPARSLFVRLKDRMRLYETRTTDFSDEELRAIKDRYGQIYADVSSKLAPDDFERDLRKLRLSGECPGCGNRATCGGCWAPAPANVFTEQRRHTEAILGALEGRILDVGCGDGPYLAAVQRRVAEGAAEYLGLDPDRARIELLRSRHPWASYHAGDLHDLPQRERARGFRHVLVLRSYNHLPDPGATMSAALSMLDVGGTLLVADNVAFGLVREARAVARAEAGPAGFEHFRNDGAAEAERVIDRPGLRMVHRRDVTEDGSNEWLLRFEKTGAT